MRLSNNTIRNIGIFTADSHIMYNLSLHRDFLSAYKISEKTEKIKVFTILFGSFKTYS